MSPTFLEPPGWWTMIICHFHWQHFALKSCGQGNESPTFQPWRSSLLSMFGFTVELEPSRPLITHLSCRSSLFCSSSQASAPSVPTCMQTSWEMTSWNGLHHRPVRRWWGTAGGSTSYSCCFFSEFFLLPPPTSMSFSDLVFLAWELAFTHLAACSCWHITYRSQIDQPWLKGQAQFTPAALSAW